MKTPRFPALVSTGSSRPCTEDAEAGKKNIKKKREKKRASLSDLTEVRRSRREAAVKTRDTKFYAEVGRRCKLKPGGLEKRHWFAKVQPDRMKRENCFRLEP